MQIVCSKQKVTDGDLSNDVWTSLLEYTKETSQIKLGAILYYVRVFWGFFEPPTHLRKDIFTT